MVDDAILSREAFLIYNNSYGFEPVDGNLMHWRGVCKDADGKHVVVTINLPPDFPIHAPQVTVDQSIVHPNVTNGVFVTRSLSRWKREFNVYQIIKEVTQVINHSRISSSAKVAMQPPKDTHEPLIRQRDYLKQQLLAKKQELEQVSQATANTYIHTDAQTTTLVQLTDDALLDIQNDLYAIEDAYDDLEIDGMEFSKKFLDLRKRYLMIQKSQN